ncbi:MAG: ABC transporter permease, partial [Chloroflexi bacterium]|nr:ABC transporter permease [Chloroflexota bacterium]
MRRIPHQLLSRYLLNLESVEALKEYVEDVRMQPLKKIYFSDIWAQKNGDLQYVYILSTIALVILLIACANYMNLATARSARRMREVGVRKVVGAHRSQLVRQFLTEALL